MTVRPFYYASRLAAIFLIVPAVFSGPFARTVAADEPPVDPGNLIVNPDFAQGTAGWSGLWTRDPGRGRAAVVARGTDAFAASVSIEHSGDKDWSFQQAEALPSAPGQIYRYGARIAFEGAGRAELSVILYDSEKKVMDWSFARTEVKKTDGWTSVERKLLVPPGAAGLRFRLTGQGPGLTRCTGLSLVRLPEKKGAAHAALAVGNAKTIVRFDAVSGELTVTAAAGPPAVFEGFAAVAVPGSVRPTGKSSIAFSLFNAMGEDARGTIGIRPDGSVLFTLRGTGPMEEEVRFPGAWRAPAGADWIVPENEGLLVPADDPDYDIPWGKTFYSGHGLCMPWLGLTDGERSALVIVETPDDAGVRFTRPAAGSPSAFNLAWQPQRGAWGYERRFTLQFTARGGYVGAAKAYRAYAKGKGLLVTLREKSRTVPDAARLPGCVDLWYWKDGAKWWPEDDPRGVAEEIREAGITRVLWSSDCGPEAVRYLNGLGFITGRYDIYQDVYPPDSPSEWMVKLNREAWPDALSLDRHGERLTGWVHRENGREYPAGVVCAQPGLELLKAHVADDLARTPFRARFIDTTTASPLRECYHPGHPLSRTDDRRWKSRQLEWLSKEKKLVTGSETGMDWAAPALHYFEGMMSLGDYRLPDSGYDLWSVRPATPAFLRFQVGPFHRIPLFELVYHDCVAAFPYWGDASNRLPDWWDVRDLQSALYGTGPLWIVDEARWRKDRERFVKSYRTATATAARAGLSEMLEHRFLTADRLVQYTRFANGTEVWVNFGERERRLPDGTTVGAKAHLLK